MTMRKFSKVAKGGICPRCGCTSFTYKRAPLRRLTTRKTRVRCNACGWQAKRG